jgi:DNA-binding CsgD family transcriptional regulator
LVAAGIIFTALNIWLGEAFNFTLPILFLTLAPAFFALAYALADRSRWTALLFIPGAIFAGLGVVFLLNVLTGDWQSWAYAWMLPLAGLGIGLIMAARAVPLRAEFAYAGFGLAVTGVTGFALFGAIAGGKVIRVMAPLLLVLGGLALRYVKVHTLLPPGLRRKLLAGTVDGRGAAGGPAVLDRPARAEWVAAGSMDESASTTGAALIEPLSPREMEVLGLIAKGLSNPEIGAKLTLAPSTVKTHINNIYGKLGVQTRAQCMVRARELGLVE